MTSGAGHDAQMIARIAPSAMIFVPSRDGISHNPREHTDADDLVAGAEGQAVSLVSHEEMDQLRIIQRLIKTDMDFALVAGF